MSNYTLQRDAILYAAPHAATRDDTNTFEIRILSDFSFPQSTQTEEVQPNESGETPTRGQIVYNTALDAVEFSFQTYMRPFIDTGAGPAGEDYHNSVEAILWEALVGDGPFETNVNKSETMMAVDFTNSDVHQLMQLDLFFRLDEENQTATKLNAAVINQAEIDFDIEGFAIITWSGMAKTQEDNVDISTWTAGTDYREFPADYDMLAMKLSILDLTDNSDSTDYNVPLTGGTLTISNNIEFLTPEDLGVVNKPALHFTGTREVSGNITAYLKSGTNNSRELFQKMVQETDTMTHSFDTTLNIGGKNAPSVRCKMPATHLTIPEVEVDVIFSLNFDFTALGTDLNTADELSVEYEASTAL